MYRIAIATTLSCALIACGNDEPTNEDYDDVAAVTAALVSEEGGEIVAMEDAVDTAAGDPPSIFTVSASGTVSGERGEIMYSYDFACRDAAGQAQDFCDETTDEAQLILSWSGEVETARRYAQLERSGDWTLSGLTGNVATFVGSGQFSVDSEFTALYRPVMRSMSLDYAATYDSIQFDRNAKQVTGGRISYSVDVERTAQRRFSEVEASFTMDVEVTFNGDRTATIVIDGLRTYELDVDSGEVEVGATES